MQTNYFGRILRKTSLLTFTALSVALSACGGVEEVESIDNDNNDAPISQNITSIDQVLGRVWDYTSSEPVSPGPNGPGASDPDTNNPPIYVTVNADGRMWGNEVRSRADANGAPAACYERSIFIGDLAPTANGNFQLIKAVSGQTADIFLSSQALFIDDARPATIYPPSSLTLAQLGTRCSDDPGSNPTPPPGGTPIDFSTFAGSWTSTGGQTFGLVDSVTEDQGLVQFTADGKFTVYNDLGDRYDNVASCYVLVASGSIIDDVDGYLKVDDKDGSVETVTLTRNGDVLTVSAAPGTLTDTHTLANIPASQPLAICLGEAQVPENYLAVSEIETITGVWNYNFTYRDGSSNARVVVIDDQRDVSVFTLIEGDGIGEACYRSDDEIGSIETLSSDELDWIESNAPSGTAPENSSANGLIYLDSDSLLLSTQNYTRSLQRSTLTPDSLTPRCGGGNTSPLIPPGSKPVLQLQALVGFWYAGNDDPSDTNPIDTDRYIEIDEYGYVSSYEFDDLRAGDPCFAAQIDIGLIEDNAGQNLTYFTEQDVSDLSIFSLDGRLYSTSDPFSNRRRSNDSGLEGSTLTPSDLNPKCEALPEPPANAVALTSLAQLNGVWNITSMPLVGSNPDSLYLGIANGALTNFIRSNDPLASNIECFIERSASFDLSLQSDNVFVLPQENGFKIRVSAYLTENELTLIGKRTGVLFDAGELSGGSEPILVSYPFVTANGADVSPRCANIDSLPANSVRLTTQAEIEGVWGDSSADDQGNNNVRYISLNTAGDVSRYIEQTDADSGEICFEDRLNIGSATLTDNESFIVDFTTQTAFREQDMQAFLIEQDLFFANQERVLRFNNTDTVLDEITPICEPSGVPTGSIPVTSLTQVANTVFGPPPGDRPPPRLAYFVINDAGAYSRYQSLGPEGNRCFIESENADSINSIGGNSFEWEERGVTKLYLSPENYLVILDNDGTIEIAAPSPLGQEAYQPICGLN